ncbi:MAG: M23 family metallopeptidase, partial [Candidatus Latescibacteria bacterium]|nr:M23 family metallopeptidase [Candidatus Latescibacterota bacterium]
SSSQRLHKNIEKSGKILSNLNLRLREIQGSDQMYRLYASGLNVLPDEDIYKAGIGGHNMYDETEISVFPDDLKQTIKDLVYGTTAIESRIKFQGKSFEEIQLNFEQDRDHIDHTPSIIPTPNSFRITDSYGRRKHPIEGYWHFHDAVDLAGTIGDPIKATANGVIVEATYQRYLGQYVKIKHKYGYETTYAHLHAIKVKEGDVVNKGDIIGTMGRTGRTSGTHLHYRVSLNGKSQNPIGYFF